MKNNNKMIYKVERLGGKLHYNQMYYNVYYIGFYNAYNINIC